MGEPQELISVETCDLIGMVTELFSEGYRLVQIGCTTLSHGYEFTYSLDREYRLKNLRVTVGPDGTVPSISVIYPGAFLYENEIHDLFGVTITHISVDYRGTLFRTAVPAPFAVGTVKLPEQPKQKASQAPQSSPVAGREEVQNKESH